MPPPSSPPNHGHRSRLRDRFLAGDIAAEDQVGLLELLLTYSIPRRDVRPLAKALLAEFGSVAGVIAASPADLQQIPGIKENSAILLSLVHRLAGQPVEIPAHQESVQESPAASVVIEEPPIFTEVADAIGTESPKTEPPDTPTKPAKSPKRNESPKLQVSNGYSLDPSQTARLLSYIAEHPDVRKFARRDLMEGTGLSEGQVESLTSIGVAMGLVTPLTAQLTPLGRLVHRHDLFLDSLITLEFCHFLGAGNPRNLIWHAIFNELLPNEKPTDQPGWCAWLRQKIDGQYSPRSLVKHVASECRFVLDAYTARNLKKLGLIHETPDKTLTLRRTTALTPHALAAMIYTLGEQHQSRLVSFDDLQSASGSPGRIFGLDAPAMRQMVEALHQSGWIRYEVRHGLDQIRLIAGHEPLEFLAAGYENRDPAPKAKPATPAAEPLLL